MSSEIETVKDVYEKFGQRDMPSLLAMFDREIEWSLAEGHPYAPEGETWVGPEAVLRNFFMRAGGEWDELSIAPGEFHAAADGVVIVECRYSGGYTATGKRFDAQACHVWKVRDGKVASFQQYIDTAQLREVMGAPLGVLA